MRGIFYIAPPSAFVTHICRRFPLLNARRVACAVSRSHQGRTTLSRQWLVRAGSTVAYRDRLGVRHSGYRWLGWPRGPRRAAWSHNEAEEKRKHEHARADGQRDGDAMGEAVVGGGEDGLEDAQAERAAG